MQLQCQGERLSAPAIILGFGVTSLGVLRVMSRAGIPVYVVCPPGDVMTYSKWFRPLELPSINGAVPEMTLDNLAALPFSRAVLMPCSDDTALMVANLPAHLRERFSSSISSPEVIETLIDKATLSQTLARFDIPRPRTILIERPSDFDVLDSWTSGRPFLKPTDSQSFFERHGVKAVWVTDKSEALHLWLEEHMVGQQMILQEYVPGPADAHVLIDGFRDREGKIRALFARRRLRMYPPDFGNSTGLVSLPLDDVRPAVEDITRLLDLLGYRGIFNVELKQDPRDGQFKLLEVNVRAWWYVEYAAWCGVDVCSLAYRDALGLPLDDIESYDVGKRLIYPDRDMRALRDLPGVTWVDKLRWLIRLLGARQPMFMMSDPVPAVCDLARQIRGFVSRRSHR